MMLPIFLLGLLVVAALGVAYLAYIAMDFSKREEGDGVLIGLESLLAAFLSVALGVIMFRAFAFDTDFFSIGSLKLVGSAVAATALLILLRYRHCRKRKELQP